MKSGPFGEHSSTLYGISAVHEWKKVNSGLVKMFKAEVSRMGVSPGNLLVSCGFPNEIHVLMTLLGWAAQYVPLPWQLCYLMYCLHAQVLGKFPVIQHFPFGSILSIQPATTPS